MKQLLFTLLLSVSLSIGAEASVAADSKILQPELRLLALKAIKTSEKEGDELYLDTLVFHSKNKVKHFRIPKYPKYWLSAHLQQVKNLKLWAEPLPVGEAVTLVLSIVEQDAPPWNTDDLIGSISVRIKNNQGKLEANWSMPNRVDGPTSIITKQGRAERFELFGQGSRYEVYLTLGNRLVNNTKMVKKTKVVHKANH